MNRILISTVYFLLTPLLIFATYNDDDKARMIADLDIIKNEIMINYAPSAWKAKCFNWELDREIALASEKILTTNPLTPRLYQQIIRDFFNSLHDLHVNVNFYTTEWASLPFIVQGVNHRYFVVWFDTHWANEYGIPLKVGDEILSFDGKPVADIITDIQSSAYSLCDSETYRHLSELQLTIREGNALQSIPHGTIEVAYRNSQREKKDSFLVEWQYIPEKIDNNSFQLSSYKLGEHPFFHKYRCLPLYTRWINHHHEPQGRNHLLGAKTSLFPPLGPITWKSNAKAFDAYIFSLKGKSIGYIRIPDFLEGNEEAEQFRNIISVMEERTHSLIIDVMNNPGGFGFYTYALLSMLIDKPLLNLKEESTITQENVYFAIQDAEILNSVDSDQAAVDSLGKDICGFPVDRKLVASTLKFAQFIQEQFKMGKFLTDPYPVEGLEYIYPHRTTRYKKPILVLANSLSMSCADLFPAILQDNKRARILGCSTAGAGGYILSRKYSNRFGVADFTLTGSLLHRFDGKPLENRGVKPDFFYEFTVKDYTQNYAEFSKFLNKILIDNK